MSWVLKLSLSQLDVASTKLLALTTYPKSLFVVATTHRNSTHSLLTSAKLSDGYLVVGITKELDKEPSLHCSSIYINYMWSVLQQYLLALISMPLPYILLLIHHASTSRPPCHIHVSWRHTLNLHHTYMHHVYTMRNHCPLMSLLTLTPI